MVLELVLECTTFTLQEYHQLRKWLIGSTRCSLCSRRTSCGWTLIVGSRLVSTLRSSLPLTTWFRLQSKSATSSVPSDQSWLLQDDETTRSIASNTTTWFTSKSRKFYLFVFENNTTRWWVFRILDAALFERLFFFPTHMLYLFLCLNHEWSEMRSPFLCK